ncbi:MAG TPA: glycosyltransferase family 2 protein [Thermoanaerobaculia bacterium]|nr:glycosyltransferase family 2 protein [Thermoanaerobaculia bacterium]
MRHLVSVVIPVYNSPDLGALADGIEAVFRKIGREYEVLLVDDGSPDPHVWPALCELAAHRSGFRAFQLTRNFGQQAATLCGLREARGDVIVTMDDDLQHDPEDIPALLAAADHDVVIGQLEQSRHGVFRRMASHIKGWLDRVLIGKPKGLRLTSYRLINRSVVDGMLSIRTPHPFLPALMFYVSKDVVGVPVRHAGRRSGRSGYTAGKLIRLFSNLVISNSSVLLRAAAYTGLAFSVLSLIVVALVIYQKVSYGVSVQGWTSLFAAIVLMGGLLLFSVGVLGEYLIRIIESSEQRPTYIIRRSASRGSND